MRFFPENETEASADNGQTKVTFWILQHLSTIKIAAVVCLAIIVCFSIIFTCLSEISFTAYIGEEKIGIVKSPNAAENALAQVKSDHLFNVDYSDVDLKFDYNIEYVPASKIMTSEEISAKIKDYIDRNYVNAYELSVNGNIIGTCECKEEVEHVVELVAQELYEKVASVDSDTNGIVPGNAIVIGQVLCKSEKLSDPRLVYGVFSSMAGVEGKLYGNYAENTAGIIHTDSTDIRVSPYTSNCDYDCGLLKNSDSTVSVYHHSHASTESQKDYAMLFNTVKTATFTEIIEYETEYLEDPELIVGCSSKKTGGTNGLREVKCEITFSPDGTELSRQIIGETVITPAIDEVYLIGTKPVPDPGPTGSYIWPLDEYIPTSEFGAYRSQFDSSRAHTGIDLGAKRGDPIYASDGGTVIEASFVSSYGLLVIIDHGNGEQSYYAHMNKILVEVGDRVYQGQQVGRVGETGVATGPHLHFEIRVNGNPINPRNRLPK